MMTVNQLGRKHFLGREYNLAGRMKSELNLGKVITSHEIPDNAFPGHHDGGATWVAEHMMQCEQEKLTHDLVSK